MRLWTLHPRYFDPRGLVALWREALLARAVLRGETTGYRRHPQLKRFRSQSAPRSATNAYPAAVYAEAEARGYSSDASKVELVRTRTRTTVTSGQLDYERQHLLRKLRKRSPAYFRRWHRVTSLEAHPLFSVSKGPIADWERPM